MSPYQQCQSTEGIHNYLSNSKSSKILSWTAVEYIHLMQECTNTEFIYQILCFATASHGKNNIATEDDAQYAQHTT